MSDAPPMESTAPRRSTTYSWHRHEVAADMAAIDSLSAGASAMDRFLSNHAWANLDGSLTVKMSVLIAKARLWGFDVAQAEAIWEELRESDRWRRSADKKRLKAVWMESLREPLVELSETRSRAGKISGEVRRAKKPTKKRTRTRGATRGTVPATEAPNSLPDNTLNTCSADVQQREREKERERGREESIW